MPCASSILWHGFRSHYVAFRFPLAICFSLSLSGTVGCFKTVPLLSNFFHMGEGAAKQYVCTANIICHSAPLHGSCWILHVQ